MSLVIYVEVDIDVVIGSGLVFCHMNKLQSFGEALVGICFPPI